MTASVYSTFTLEHIKLESYHTSNFQVIYTKMQNRNLYKLRFLFDFYKILYCNKS